MSALGKKKSPLERRMKRVRKELSSLNSDLRALTKSVRNPEKAAEILQRRRRETESQRSEVRGQRSEGRGQESEGRGQESERGRREAGAEEKQRAQRVVEDLSKRFRDERFADYLASSFQSVRPLRHERRIQRNKAIVMAVFVLFLLLWLLQRFFL